MAAIVYATLAAVSYPALFAYAVCFILSVIIFSPEQLPNPITIGILIAFSGFLQLTKPRFFILVAGCGGMLAGLWFAVMQLQTLAFMPALLIAVTAPCLTIWFAVRRKRFIPLTISEESLSITIVLGLALAFIPDLVSGWQSAIVLNRDAMNAESHPLSLWIIIVIAGSLILGSLYAARKSR